MCDSKTYQTHTFSRVFRERFRGSTLCLEPSERTQFLDWLGLATRRLQDKHYNENNDFFRAGWIVKYFATFDVKNMVFGIEKTCTLLMPPQIGHIMLFREGLER